MLKMKTIAVAFVIAAASSIGTSATAAGPSDAASEVVEYRLAAW